MINRIGSRGRKRGLGIICLTQRPAKLDNDYISNADWRLWHWMDWPNDLDVVRKVLDKEWEQEVKDMDVGSAVMECPFADVDIQKVRILRKETFDAGATPTLEDMDRPELKSVSGDLVEELQEISEQKRREEDRITQLEQELEEKDQEIERLEEDLERAKDVSDMAEQFQQSLIETVNNTGDSDASEQIEEKIEELRDEKNQRIRELEKQNEEYEERVAELEQQVEELEQYREYKDRFEDWEEKRDVVREALYRLSDELDIEVDGDVEKYKQRIQRQEQRIEELEQTLNRLEEKDGESVKEERFEDAAAFLENDLGAEYVERAADNTTYSEDHFWDALTVIAREGKCTSGDIAPLVDIAKNSVSGVLSSLESNKVLVSESKGNSKAYALNIDGIDEILGLKERRKQIRQKSQQLKNGGDNTE